MPEISIEDLQDILCTAALHCKDCKMDCADCAVKRLDNEYGLDADAGR